MDNPQGCRSPELQQFVENYNDTYDLLSKARASGHIPAGMKSVLANAQMMNAVAKVRLLEIWMALGFTQASSNVAGQAGIHGELETLGVFAKWAAILFGVEKAVGAKETAATSSEAASVNAQAALRAKLSGLQNAQECSCYENTS